MNYFKRGCVLLSVLVLGACSYFDTGETIEVTSEDLDQEVVFVDENNVENLFYKQTDGAVEIYNLDVSEQEAVDNFVPFAKPSAAKDASVIEIEPGVEIYPIDIPMQKTLKPTP